MDVNIKKRLRLSKVLAVMAILLFIFTYISKPLFEYRDPVAMDEEDEIEENLSFQPFSFLVPAETESFEPPLDYLKPLMGDKIWDFQPEGLYAFLAGARTVPVWRVSLEAPQYPKESFPDGIPVFFHMTDFSGKVNEMNTINHYIGMDPMEVGAVFLRQIAPFVYFIFTAMLIVYLFYSGPFWWILGIVPALMPWYYLFFYGKWLYWFGHNMHEFGQFKVKPFMPTVFGDGKVAQFTTHSYPAIGFYFLLGYFLLMLLSVLIRRKAMRDLTTQS